MEPIEIDRRTFLGLGAGALAATAGWSARAQAQARPLTVGAATPYRHVRRDERPATTVTRLSCSVPRGGSHSHQLILRAPARTTATVSLKLAGTGVTGEVFEQRYIQVTRPTAPRLFPAGWYPDALVPLQRDRALAVQPDRNTGIWVTLHAAADAPAGVYRGDLMITVAGSQQVRIPVVFEVIDFVIDRSGLTPSSGMIWGGQLADYYGVAVDSAEYWRLMRAYYELQLDHWLTPTDLPLSVDDPAQWARDAQTLLADPRVTSFRIPHFQTDAGGLDVERTRQFADAVVRGGHSAKAYFYLGDMIDEPQPRQYEQVRTLSRQLRALAPSIDHLVTTDPKPELDAAVDVWGAEVHTVDEEVVAWAHERDEKLWWFPTFNTRAPYTAPFIDSGLSGARLLPQMTAALKFDGILSWCTNYFSKYPDDTPRDVWRDPAAAPPSNGDGYLLYPGPDGPIATVRLDAFRRGQQDVAELNAFRARAAVVARELGYRYDAAATLAHSTELLFRSPDDVTHDPALIEEVRRQQLFETRDLARAPRLLLEVKTSAAGTVATAITEPGCTVTINATRPSEDRRAKHSLWRYPVSGGEKVQLEVKASKGAATVTTRRLVAVRSAQTGRLLLEFRNSADLARLRATNVRVGLEQPDGARLIYAANVEFPNIRIAAADLGGSDWSRARAIELTVANPGDQLAAFRLKVYGLGGDAEDLRGFWIRPRTERVVRVIPELMSIDPKRIDELEIWIWKTAATVPLTLRRVRWIDR